ncbi:MAG: AMP-binding protein, partial [Thermoplasmata archaeon]|nr:AMP-binding protein [Thermoplasmata archaeon]
MLDPGEEYHDLVTLVRSKAKKNGDRPALRFAGCTLSYSELDRETDRVAGALVAAGIRPGERVAALLFNTPEFPLLWFGAAKAGNPLVPLNTALKGELLRYELADSGACALVIDERLWATYSEISAGLPLRERWVVAPDPAPTQLDASARAWSDALQAGGPPPEHLPAPSDPAAVLYTSGTTGPPKGAVIPHEKYLRTPREVGSRSRLTPTSVLFTALPLFHCNAQEMTTLTALEYDLTAAYDERFSASHFWESATSYGATHVSLLISMINVLYKQPERPTDRTHGVRTSLAAGTSREIWRSFEARFDTTIIELYGMTECG